MRSRAPAPGIAAPRSGALRPSVAQSPLLALQRAAGNRAVSAMVQRACCGGCAAGTGCDSDRDEAATAAPEIPGTADESAARDSS